MKQSFHTAIVLTATLGLSAGWSAASHADNPKSGAFRLSGTVIQRCAVQVVQQDCYSMICNGRARIALAGAPPETTEPRLCQPIAAIRIETVDGKPVRRVQILSE